MEGNAELSLTITSTVKASLTRRETRAANRKTKCRAQPMATPQVLSHRQEQVPGTSDPPLCRVRLARVGAVPQPALEVSHRFWSKRVSALYISPETRKPTSTSTSLPSPDDRDARHRRLATKSTPPPDSSMCRGERGYRVMASHAVCPTFPRLRYREVGYLKSVASGPGWTPGGEGTDACFVSILNASCPPVQCLQTSRPLRSMPI